jgi:hypothetical protein
MASMHNTEANIEPPVHELLSDPITELLMQTDGVERAALDPLLHDIMDKISMVSAAHSSDAAKAEVA